MRSEYEHWTPQHTYFPIIILSHFLTLFGTAKTVCQQEKSIIKRATISIPIAIHVPIVHKLPFMSCVECATKSVSDSNTSALIGPEG